MPRPKTIILHSGGLDSTALIDFYLRQGHNVSLLHISYGQLSQKKEILAVKTISKFYRVQFINVHVRTPISFRDGFVMGRNFFFASSGLTFAALKSGQIAMGLHKGTGYVDSTNEFVRLCNEFYTLYSNGLVILTAPFLQWNKMQIYKYCLSQEVPINLTYSCELGLKQPCGKCSSCKEIIRLHGAKN
jgi:7-cyano-7-deazaguanine synthase